MTKRRVTPRSESAKPADGRKAKSNGSPKKSKRRSVASRAPRASIGDNGRNMVEAPKPMPKTKLTTDELETFRDLLIQKRRQLVGDLDSMENEALRKNRTTAAGDLSMMPIHMADIGTDNYEQEFTIGLLENERDQLKEIDAALERIKNGTYGVCMGTHKQIAKARLRAKPWAKYCIQYKRSQEQSERR
ncbi:MAG: TraR/DksA family transcriptional regulator [Phycisphaerales bacterium]|nr:TraR/DksA family transcriptional regulator [Phycisphaerales bacterium]